MVDRPWSQHVAKFAVLTAAILVALCGGATIEWFLLRKFGVEHVARSSIEEEGVIGLSMSADGRVGVSLLTMAMRESASKPSKQVVMHRLTTNDTVRLGWDNISPVAVAITPSGNSIAVADRSGDLYEFSLQSAGDGVSKPRFLGNMPSGQIDRLEYSPDGSFLAVVTPNQICLKERKSGKDQLNIPREKSAQVILAFSVDSNRLLVGVSDQRLVLFDLATKSRLKTINIDGSKLINAGFSASADSVIAILVDGTLQTYALITGAVQTWATIPRFSSNILQPKFSPNGALLAVVDGYNETKIYETRFGRPVGSVMTDSATITGAAITGNDCVYVCDFRCNLHSIRVDGSPLVSDF